MSRTGRGVLERRGCSALCWQGSESMRYAVLLLVGLLLAACSPEDTTVTPSPSPTQAPTATPSASPSATESKAVPAERHDIDVSHRSEEHTSELQSLMRTSYAGFCLNKKKTTTPHLR